MCYSCNFRHHHRTDARKVNCNTSLTTAHEDICILFRYCDEQSYRLDVDCAMKALANMKARHTTACWTCFVGKTSVVVIESDYEEAAWKSVWKELIKHYDRIIPQRPKSITDLRNRLNGILEVYMKENTRNLGEVSKISAIYGRLELPMKWSAYFKATATEEEENSKVDEDTFNSLTYEIAGHVENGINFLCVEASEILAFVATDCEHIYSSSIPPHLPIAYGLKGNSLPMSVMREIINDIRFDLKNQNTGVLCEVYDGQFHPIIVKSEKGEPLTRLQHAIQFFRTMMKEYERSELVHELLKYSDIASDDVKYICEMTFKDGLSLDLDSVRLQMNKFIQEDIIERKIYIETIDFNGFQMKDIVTLHRREIWLKYMKNKFISKPQVNYDRLTCEELKEMIEGTRLHRRLASHLDGDVTSEISDLTSTSADPDYVPGDESEISDNEDLIMDDDMSIEPNISTLSTTSEGNTCMRTILHKLQTIENRHNWINESVDSFVWNYLSSRNAINKLFKYEMDIINEEVSRYFHKQLFKKNDSKEVRVKKIYNQLRQMPQMMMVDSSEDEVLQKYEPLRLLDIYRNYITSSKYPKEYLAAAVCKIRHRESVAEWEGRSPIPINLELPFLDDVHIIFNYPEFSEDRQQIEMRTFDYTHILNNLRFHICNKGFDEVKTDAFMCVSKVNHDVLPLAIVEDKLDRQNCQISQRFFSEDVQKILQLNGDKSEANFVEKTRNWFRACDERGMSVEVRMKYLHDMYSFLLSRCDLYDYPPATTHISGIPIKTFEALLHSISTRFSLYQLSSTRSYNTRAISTLAVESFFSDLARYEFSGLGAPKSVDIPKLISHVVHINTTKHNPERGFEFTTSTRDNYPVYLMDTAERDTSNSNFQQNLFDITKYKKKYKSRRWFTLSKPKEVLKGGKGVRQYFKIDESKLTLEQHFGQKVTIDKFEI